MNLLIMFLFCYIYCWFTISITVRTVYIIYALIKLASVLTFVEKNLLKLASFCNLKKSCTQSWIDVHNYFNYTHFVNWFQGISWFNICKISKIVSVSIHPVPRINILKASQPVFRSRKLEWNSIFEIITRLTLGITSDTWNLADTLNRTCVLV